MPDKSGDIEPVIQGIRTSTAADYAKTGSVALLNLIPYAGGAIAAIVGDIATQRKYEKICDVLSTLNQKLEDCRVEPEKYLTKDQIIEVVHDTLQTVVTASDQKKIDALKRGLGYSFISEDSFERKQILLQVLRGCSSLELRLLSQIYTGHDPYLVKRAAKTLPDDKYYEPGQRITLPGAFAASPSLAYGYWQPISNQPDCGQPPLIQYLTQRLNSEEAITARRTPTRAT